MKARNKISIIVCLFFSISTIYSQDILISQGGTITVDGTEMFYDAGGSTGNDGNTNYTITLTPSVAGKAVCVDFTSFISFLDVDIFASADYIRNADRLEIYDGSTTGDALIGSLQGDYSGSYNTGPTPNRSGQRAANGFSEELKPGKFCASNANGTLTFSFINIQSNTTAGWEANVSLFDVASIGCTVDINANPTSICPGDSTTLTANGVVGTATLTNDFNTGVLGTGWTGTNGSFSFFTQLSCEPNLNNTTINDGSIYVWMQSTSGARQLTSQSFDISNGGVISFDMRMASDDDGGNGCESTDQDEGVYLQYSTDGGGSWTTFKYIFPCDEADFGYKGVGDYIFDWTTIAQPIPAAAETANTSFRWIQGSNSSGNTDSWGIDNVNIITKNPTTLTITDLSTNTVIATSALSSVSVDVSPSTTTNYRATITDGVSTCSEDITVTVTSGAVTTIAYSASSYTTSDPNQTIAVTNGPVTGAYTSSPAGLTIDSTTGEITPNTSATGIYTVTVPTSCGTTDTTVEITASSCSTCATASCPVESITETTAALGQTNITTVLAAAGDQLGLAPLTPGESVTVCVPVTVPVGSTVLGFKQRSQSTPGACGDPSEEVITYELVPATNCAATPIVPDLTNASSVASGFNPEWNNLTAGDYVLCYTMSVTNPAICSSVDIESLGYYNVIPTSNIIYTCSGTFTDTGNAGNYGNNESWSVTYCPDTPGDIIQMDFTSFSTEDSLSGACYDFLNFWQGIEANPETAAPDTQYCGTLAPFSITSTSPDGCITFYFESDSSIPDSGWSATISCFTPCTPPTAAMVDASIVDICGPDSNTPGSLTVNFDASNSTATAGQVITTYEWDFGDGTTITTTSPTTSHTYPSDDEIYVASVAVRDDNTSEDPLGCKSTNAVTKIIRILPDPDFTGSSTTININCGESANLTGLVTSQTETQETPIFNAATINLPDGTGVAYTSTIDFTGFFPSGTTMSATCYPVLSFDIEHSATQDLEITLISPSGQSVVVFDRLGDATDPTGFGACVNQDDDGVPGCSTTYSIVNSGGADWANAASHTTTSTPCATYTGPCSPIGAWPNIGYYYVSQTYNSDNPFSTLDGADLNGIWTLEIIDHEVNDDGVLETWSLSFPQTCYSLETVTPDLTTAVWSHSGTGPAVPSQTTTSTNVTDPGSDICPTTGTCTGTELSNDITVGPFSTTGPFTYTLTTTDEFGCEYEHDVTINVAPCVCTISGTLSACVGSTTQLTGSGTANATNPWVSSNVSVATVSATGLITGVSDGTTDITYTDTNGCMVTETVTINPLLSPTISCGTATLTSTQFNWAAVPGATSYTISYQIGANPIVNIGNIGNILTYTASSTGPNPINASDTVEITVTPIGPTGTCLESASLQCTAANCTPPMLTLSSAAGTDAQTICINTPIVPITYDLTAGTSGAAGIILSSGAFPTGITGSFSSGVYTISGTPTTVVGSPFNYTLTTTGGCSNPVIAGNITVNSQVTPTFTQVADICEGDTLAVLPLVSNNGINGTWSPALDNTATTLYTFTPDTGECATVQTMTITVNSQVTPTFTQVADICEGDTLTALPLVSNNGINGTWSPALDNTTTTLYTFTPDTGECATVQTMTITVNSQVTPTFTQVADICEGDTLAALPLVSNNGINGTWSPALDNTTTTLYTFTPDTGECATVQTMTITVNSQVTPTFTQVADICEGDTLAALPLVSNNGINGTWSPALDNTTTTLYTFTPDTGECATVQTMTITVNSQVTPTFTQVADICEGDTLAALPLVSNNGINGTWSPALDNTATTLYTFTPDTGECATIQTMTITVNSQVIPTFTQVADICEGDTLAALPLVSNNGINGTWSPALDNTATTLYTFTPDTGECATVQTMTITVNSQVTPTFTQVADICEGDTLTALPLVSNNGINGTWSPALDNTATTLYTFTPDTGECATVQTMTITVNSQVTPTFTQVADICEGDTLTTLPLVSNNGINGTWLPALDNTATTLYTFTPDTGECATVQTMTITVNSQVTPTFTQVADICEGDTLAPLPLVSNNGINGTWSPALDNTTTTLYTFTPDTGECATVQTMTITVNSQVTPTFTQVADICEGDTLTALPLVSNNGINGTWSPALDNTATTLYTFTPDAGECATVQTMTITVNSQVTPTFTQVADICEGDTLTALPLVSNNGINGTWSPALDNTATTLYTFTPDAGECATVQTMTITVNSQVTPTFTQVADICEGDTLTPLPLVSNNGINGTWSPALDNTATTLYTFTPDTSECATVQTMTITVNSQVTPTFTQVADICEGDTLAPLPLVSNNGINGTWSPALDNTATTLYTFTPDAGECATVQTMTITVNSQVTPTFTQVADICEGDTLAALPLVSNNGINGTWSPALDNTATTLYTFTPDTGECATVQTMTITVNSQVTPTFTQVADICEGDTLAPLPLVSNNGINGTWSPALDNTTTTLYTFTPDTGECATVQTMTITVNSQVTPTFTQVADICEGDTLTALPLVSNNGINGTWSPVLDNTATTLYTFTPDTGECATVQTMTITVNSQVTPTFTQVADICEGDTLTALPLVSNNGINGTWSPALDNTATTLYTFTPDTGECATVETMTITVVSITANSSPAPLEYCDTDNDGFGVFTLSDAINQITGGATDVTVSFYETPEDADNAVNSLMNTYTNINADNQTIYVRVEHVVSGCFNVVALDLIVHHIPEIAALDAVSLAECDDISANQIAQFDLTQSEADILNGEDPTTHTIRYYNTQVNAIAGTATGEINNPNAYSNIPPSPETIWVRVEDQTTGCVGITNLTLIVNELPVLVQLTGLELCDAVSLNDGMEVFDLTSLAEDLLNSMPGISLQYYASAADLTNNIPIANPTMYSNVEVGVQTIFVKGTNDTTGCENTITFDIRVNPLPSPTLDPNGMLTADICDDDNDGFASFDLTSLTSAIINNEPDVVYTFHETETGANNNLDALTSPYTNIVMDTQTLYVLATNTVTGCFTVTPLIISVSQIPELPLNITDLTVCDQADSLNGITMFDLTQTQTEIYGTQTPGDYTLTYHESEADAINGSNPIVNLTSYTNIIANQQTIWVRLEQNTTNCYAIGSFDLIVAGPPVLVQPTPFALCDDAESGDQSDELTTFNLTDKYLEITGGDTSLTLSYYANAADLASDAPIADPTSYQNVVNPQILYIRATNAAGCTTDITMTLRILPIPTPNPMPEPLTECDDDIDGVLTFDLTLSEAEIVDNENNVTVSYHVTQMDAADNLNPIIDPTMHMVDMVTANANGQVIIYVRVQSDVQIDSNMLPCYTIVELPVIVHPLPVLTDTDFNFVFCEYDADNTGQFDWDVVTASLNLLTAPQDVNDFTVSYHPTVADALAGTGALTNGFENTSDPQTVFIRVENTTTGCVNTNNIASLELSVEPIPTATAPSTYELCASDETDQNTAVFDLTSLDAVIINGQTNMVVSYYETATDAAANINAIANADSYTNTSNPQTLYANVRQTITGCISDPIIVNLQVNPLPVFTLPADDVLCIDADTGIALDIRTIGVDFGAGYTYQWTTPNGTATTATIEVTTIGTYSVIVTDENHPTNCTYTDSVTYEASSAPSVLDIQVTTPAFADVHNVTATASGGSGNYEYQLDDGEWQISGEFLDLQPGEHVITVSDTNGCGELIRNFLIIDYMKFFTPNGDAYNPTWNIIGLQNQPGAKIYIFDRYGKLLKQISPAGQGWDGTFNGNPMPSNDYWFKVEYEDPFDGSPKEFKNHFTLKR